MRHTFSRVIMLLSAYAHQNGIRANVMSFNNNNEKVFYLLIRMAYIGLR